MKQAKRFTIVRTDLTESGKRFMLFFHKNSGIEKKNKSWRKGGRNIFYSRVRCFWYD